MSKSKWRQKVTLETWTAAVAAFVGAVVFVAAGMLLGSPDYRAGVAAGKEQARAECQDKSSLQKYANVYGQDIKVARGALEAFKREPNPSTRAAVVRSAQVLKAHTDLWRPIVDSFRELLDGLVEDLGAALGREDFGRTADVLELLVASSEGKIQAFEAALARSP